MSNRNHEAIPIALFRQLGFQLRPGDRMDRTTHSYGRETVDEAELRHVRMGRDGALGEQ